jgi:hypothetical protein
MTTNELVGVSPVGFAKLTIKGVHQRIAGNCGGSTAHSYTANPSVPHSKPSPQTHLTGSQGVVSIVDITTSHFLHNFVCTEVDRVCRTYRESALTNLANPGEYAPAPTTTLETPFHSVRQPSTR